MSSSRRRGREDVLVEGVAVPGALEAPAGEGRGDLGAAPVARAELGGSRAVGDQHAAGVDDHHAAADRRRGGDHELAQLVALPSCEPPGRGGRHHVGLAARLQADLLVLTVAQRDGERQRERDDREQQDVREREQQPDAEAYGAISSGALKRKPTPRTVCR
jgi:hypothetical protein